MNKTQDGDGRVFYSLRCTFWSEDWRRIGKNTIPCCPSCGSPGFETSFTKFLDSAKEHEIMKDTGYFYFLVWLKNRCYRSLEEARLIYKEFLELDNQY